MTWAVLGVVGITVASAWAAFPGAAETRVHVRNAFAFDVSAPREIVAPLFGANREKAWAEGWDPQFLWPLPADDREGEIFTVTHGGHTSTWVNTALDLAAGHVQYAYVAPELMAVAIDIHVTGAASGGSHVEVVYERTALSARADEHVKALGEADAKSGADWRQAIEECLKKEGKLR
jgi:hypothetical protein